MIENITLVSALLMGLFSAPHCAGMCGGIVGALSMQSASTNKSRSDIIVAIIKYNFGRVITYGLLGIIFGTIGMSLHQVLPVASQLLRAIAGLLMISMGLYVGGWWLGLQRLERIGFRIWQSLQRLTTRNRPGSSSNPEIVAGFLWGCLPCGMVYSVLALAMTTGDTLMGGLLMLAFGLGTLPALVLAGVLYGELTAMLRGKVLRSVMGVVVVLFGVWTLVGAVVTEFDHHQDNLALIEIL